VSHSFGLFAHHECVEQVLGHALGIVGVHEGGALMGGVVVCMHRR